jgi:hypothetical protein
LFANNVNDMVYPLSSGPIAVLAMRMNDGTFIEIVDRAYDPLLDGADLVDLLLRLEQSRW